VNGNRHAQRAEIQPARCWRCHPTESGERGRRLGAHLVLDAPDTQVPPRMARAHRARLRSATLPNRVLGGLMPAEFARELTGKVIGMLGEI
jgi:hypothetical protein